MSSLAQLILSCFSLLMLLSIAECTSHYCPTKYSVSVKKRDRYHTSCGWAHLHRCTRYRTYYKTEYKYHNTCCTGWKGTSCNIPICNPKCANNAVCYDKDKCFCRSAYDGAACNIAKCSFSLNCFPGTCHSGDDRCICVTGFTGSNCNTMNVSPKFNKCNIKLLATSDDQEKVVFTGQCDSKKTYFSNGRGVAITTMNWETQYEPVGDFPQRPPYIGHYAMGVVSTSGHFTLRNADDKTIYNETISCPSPVSSSNPHLVSECRDVRYKLKSVVAHHYQIEVAMTASTGGYKKVLNTESHNLIEQSFTGLSTSQTIRVIIDLLPPTHCATTDTCGIGDIPPVDVGREIDNSTYSKRFVGCGAWKDADSGLSTFSYKIFPLAPDSEGQLVEKTASIAEGRPTSSCMAFPSYVPVDARMYSVVLTVEDAAGNAAVARGLFLWDAQSRVTITNTPMSVTGAPVVRDNVVWLMSRVNSFVVSWQGHFENAFQHDNKLLNKVKPWPADKGLDDLYGERTVDAISNVRGIVRFDVGCDYANSSVPMTMSNVGLKESLEFHTTVADGDSIRVLVRAVDVTGNNATDSLIIRVDSTPPIFLNHRFEKNVDSSDSNLPYSSRISMDVFDKESGIMAIAYNVIDVTEGIQVWKGTVEGHLETNTTACREHGTCVCTSFDECFLYKHDFYLNHCSLLKNVGHEFQVKASITNMAELATPVEINLGAMEGLSGVQVYPKVSKLGVSKIYGSKALIEWNYGVSCYGVKWVTFHYKAVSGVEREVRLLARSKSYVLENLAPVTDYVVHVVIMYEGDQRSEDASLRFNSGGIGPVKSSTSTTKVPTTTAPTSPVSGTDQTVTASVKNVSGKSSEVKLTTMTLIGICAVMLLMVVVIIVLVVFVVTRRRRQEPLLPSSISDFGRTMRQSVHFGNDYDNNTVMFRNNLSPPSTQSPAAEAVPENDAEEDNGSWKIAAEHVVVGQRLPNANGRFADIHEATMIVKNGKQNVVAKKLKLGGNAESKQLMLAKMNFWATVPKHENVLHFIGAVPSGPVLLFELCDLGPLRDWLTAQNKVTEDLADKMITFGSHIARGMQHLHSHEIVHRRLGARNVLLKSAALDGVVARVAGFGPMKDEVERANAKEKVPVKWMAPEQLNMAPGEVRKYDKTTDVWSYAVTLWEIFSKGEDPYSDQDKSTLKTLLESGYRMPRPVHCEDSMYDEVMEPCWNTHTASRPSFADVIGKIDELFIGGAAGDDYDYDVTEDSNYVELVNASTPVNESTIDNPMYTLVKSDVKTNVNEMP